MIYEEGVWNISRAFDPRDPTSGWLRAFLHVCVLGQGYIYSYLRQNMNINW